MPRIKITIQEEQRKTVPHPQGGEMYSDETYWETVHEVTSTDASVVAGSLRAIADKYNPPTKAYRGTD